MDKRYIFLSVLLLLMGVLAAFVPEKNNKKQLEPNELLLEIIDQTRYKTTDQLAAFIVDEDPSVRLIDVRSPEEYLEFHLPGAINIPLDSMLNKTAGGYYEFGWYLDPKDRRNVFYSNGTVYANQAWVLTRRLNFNNNYVLQGGLNKWVETILQPPVPHSQASGDEWDLYRSRKAASMFFTGGDATPVKSEVEVPVDNLPVKKKQTQLEGGGC